MNLENIANNYHKLEGGFRKGFGDSDYALHELAHFVVLFRRAPRLLVQELHDMEFTLDMMTCGLAQLHELRVIKLQSIALRVAAKPMLKSVMFGIYDVAAAKERRQKDVVTSLSRGLFLMKHIHVSPRLVRAYLHALERFS